MISLAYYTFCWASLVWIKNQWFQFLYHLRCYPSILLSASPRACRLWYHISYSMWMTGASQNFVYGFSLFGIFPVVVTMLFKQYVHSRTYNVANTLEFPSFPYYWSHWMHSITTRNRSPNQFQINYLLLVSTDLKKNNVEIEPLCHSNQHSEHLYADFNRWTSFICWFQQRNLNSCNIIF